MRLQKHHLTVPAPLDGLTPDNTEGGVYKAMWDYAADAELLMIDLHDGYGHCRCGWNHEGTASDNPDDPDKHYIPAGIWKHLVTYIGATNYFYGRWKQHRRGPDHHGSARIAGALDGGAAIAFSVIHHNEELEDAFIHTSGVAKDDKTGNILHIDRPDRHCPYCAVSWNITHQNRCFIARYHHIWDGRERSWLHYDAAKDEVTSVRKLPPAPPVAG